MAIDQIFRRVLGRRVDPRFVLEDFQPAYLAERWTDEALSARVEEALQQLETCRVCPHECGVDRLQGETGICGSGRRAHVSSAFPHLGEEDCLRGWRGSGTIFFSQCNLHCVFCQNADISSRLSGDELGVDAIAALMLGLAKGGCHNINFVTPSHVVPQVIEAIATARDSGLQLPIVYNSGGYDSVAALELLDGLVDIYMPDFKLWSAVAAGELTEAADYPERARAALREMHRQVGALRYSPDGVARRGLLVRHLVMPGRLEDTAAIMSWLAEELSPDTFVNLMAQYRPAHRVGERGRDGAPLHEPICRRPTAEELARAEASADSAGIWRLDGRGGI